MKIHDALKTLPVLIVFLSNTGNTADIPASNFFKKAQQIIDIRIKPEDTIVFDELENDDYYLEGRDLNLIADKLKVNGNVIIKSFRNGAPNTPGEGAPGANGVSQQQGNKCKTGIGGGNGAQGSTGHNGQMGNSASVIKLDIGEIAGLGKISFDSIGQKGGTGQKGGRGGDGGKGGDGGDSKSGLGCECGGADGGPGGNGGPGGMGGNGGPGGKGGTIVLSARTSHVSQRLAFNVRGGEGGEPGLLGNSGAAGPHSSGGAGGGLCGGGRSGVPGGIITIPNSAIKGPNGPDGVVVEF